MTYGPPISHLLSCTPPSGSGYRTGPPQKSVLTLSAGVGEPHVGFEPAMVDYRADVRSTRPKCLRSCGIIAGQSLSFFLFSWSLWGWCGFWVALLFWLCCVSWCGGSCSLVGLGWWCLGLCGAWWLVVCWAWWRLCCGYVGACSFCRPSQLSTTLHTASLDILQTSTSVQFHSATLLGSTFCRFPHLSNSYQNRHSADLHNCPTPTKIDILQISTNVQFLPK